MEKSVYSRKSRKKHTVHKLCAWMLAVLMLFSALPTGSMTVHATDTETVTGYWTDDAYVATAFAGSGDGTEGNPFIIETEAQLAYMAKVLTGADSASYISSHFKVADGVTEFDMSAHEWTPISEFAGVFDGNGVTINGLTIKTTSAAKTGFFSFLNEGAKVQNIDFTYVNIDASCDVDAPFCVGTIAGRVNGTAIDNCKVLSGEIKATGLVYENRTIHAGGLVGDIYNNDGNSSKTIITNCFNNSSVKVETSVKKTIRLGGIFGSIDQKNANAEIINCANIGSVTGTNTSANAYNNRFGGFGGIVTNGTIVIKNCYNAGTVSAGTGCKSYKTGGILGAGTGTIENCYYVEGTFNNAQGTSRALTSIQSPDFVITLNTNVNILSATYPGLLNWKLTTLNATDKYPIPTAEARINSTNYSTLQEAITAANNTLTSGNVTSVEIDLQADITASDDIEIKSGVTLDLNGHTLNMGNNCLYSYYGNVVDNFAGKTGRLKVGTYAEGEKENIQAGTPKGTLAPGNSQMPIYTDKGYMFADMFGQGNVTEATWDDFTVTFRPSFGKEHAAKLANGADAAKLEFIIRLDWIDKDKDKKYYQLFKCKNDLVQTVYGQEKAFSVKFEGLTGYKAGMKVTVFVKSDLGVESLNNEYTMQITSNE